MEELLKNSALLLVIITLLYVVINGIAMTERKRVMLVYIFAYVLAAAGTFQLRYILVGTFVVLLLALEFLSDDTRRLQLLTRPDYKLADFLYRMFVEYACGYFLLSMWAIFAAHLWQSNNGMRLLLQILAGGCIAVAVAVITAQKYATRSVTAIMDRIEGDMLTYQLSVTPHMRDLFAILTSIEDRQYFERKDRQHTVPLMQFFTKGFVYVQTHWGFGAVRAFRNLFKRGYGTIEMQLLRSVGVEFGYVYDYRRKLFEVLYATMLFNSYLAYLKRAHGEYGEYREYILYKYIENVNVKINGHLYTPTDKQSSLLRMFDKQDINDISKEQFLVWCLGLPQKKRIEPIDLYYKGPLMLEFNIDKRVVERLLVALR